MLHHFLCETNYNFSVYFAGFERTCVQQGFPLNGEILRWEDNLVKAWRSIVYLNILGVSAMMIGYKALLLTVNHAKKSLPETKIIQIRKALKMLNGDAEE